MQCRNRTFRPGQEEAQVMQEHDFQARIKGSTGQEQDLQAMTRGSSGNAGTLLSGQDKR
jgi:hypothetical protein